MYTMIKSMERTKRLLRSVQEGNIEKGEGWARWIDAENVIKSFGYSSGDVDDLGKSVINYAIAHEGDYYDKLLKFELYMQLMARVNDRIAATTKMAAAAVKDLEKLVRSLEC